MGVTKNIIPAVASTNAIVSAACTMETIKILTECAPIVDNYMQYLGQSNLTCSDFQMERKPDCYVCTREVLKQTAPGDMKVSEWLYGTKNDDGEEVFQGILKQYMLNMPTLTSIITKKKLTGTGVYKNECAPKLDKTFKQLIAEGEIQA